MLQIDRNSPVSIRQQIADAIRLKIVSGSLRAGYALPSSRSLAKEVGVSFHTVQKAYRDLAQSDVIRRSGRKFIVGSIPEIQTEDKNEEGASIVQSALTRLMSLGLSEDEIDYLIDEQRSLIASQRGNRKVVFVVESAELNREATRQLESVIRAPVEMVTPDTLWRHSDADIVAAPPRLLRRVSREFQQSMIVGMTTFLDAAAVSTIGLMHDHETLGVITFEADTVSHLTRLIKTTTSYAGQIIATSVSEGTSHLAQFVSSTDVVVFTEMARRRALPFLAETRAKVIGLVAAKPSLDQLQDSLPMD